MSVTFQFFVPTFGWSTPQFYCGYWTSWSLGIDGKRHYRGGCVSTDEASAPVYDARTAWKAVHRLRRIGFKAEMKHAQP